MTTTIKVSELKEFDAADYLETPEDIAVYLNDILQEGNAELLAVALGDVARSKGMTMIAEKSGITREALYKALRSGAEPRFETVSKVCKALGLRLTVTADTALAA